MAEVPRELILASIRCCPRDQRGWVRGHDEDRRPSPGCLRLVGAASASHSANVEAGVINRTATASAVILRFIVAADTEGLSAIGSSFATFAHGPRMVAHAQEAV
jgi:hypothetical protein